MLSITCSRKLYNNLQCISRRVSRLRAYRVRDMYAAAATRQVGTTTTYVTLNARAKDESHCLRGRGMVSVRFIAPR